MCQGCCGEVSGAYLATTCLTLLVPSIWQKPIGRNLRKELLLNHGI